MVGFWIGLAVCILFLIILLVDLFLIDKREYTKQLEKQLKLRQDIIKCNEILADMRNK